MTQADVLRELIQKGMEYDEVEAERDRLQGELQATNRRIDERQKLVRYVEEERSLRERREQRRGEREEAGILRRGKRFLFGRDSLDGDE